MKDAATQFEERAREKERRAVEEMARTEGYRTLEDRSGDFPVARLESPWIERVFGGPFYRSLSPREPDLPVVSLVFVQDRAGNVLTESGRPADLQGGPTDRHALYEGLSRVDADGVAAGGKTVGRLPFSVWHPEWIRLRLSLGLGRHPAQIVLSPAGNVDPEQGLLFNLSELPVYLVTRPSGWERLRRSLERRPWIRRIEAGDPLDWREALRTLKQSGIKVLSLVGGPTTATGAVDQGVVTDLYLTTSALAKGLPRTPWYRGERPPPMDLVVRKAGQGIERGITFEHFLLTRSVGEKTLI